VNLILQRGAANGEITRGVLFVTGFPRYFTIEPPLKLDGKINIPEKTAILPGTYTVMAYHSPHLGRRVLSVLNVPGRENIEVHPLNKVSETEGCIGVGHFWSPQGLLSMSVDALDELLAFCDAAWNGKDVVLLTIHNWSEAVNV
jgi:hypothetical protein